MARILCVASDVPGVLYTCVELSRRLAAEGHEVVYAGPAGAGRVARANGLHLLPLEASRYDEFLAEDAAAGYLSRLSRLEPRRERAQASLAVDGFAQRVRALEPDLLLIDGEMHEHVIAVSSVGAPMAMLNSFVSIWRRRGVPPPHRLARPGVGLAGTSFGMWLQWQELALAKRRRAWARKAARVGCDRLSLLRRLAHENRFDWRRNVDGGQWLRPFTYRRLPVLSLHAFEFGFSQEPPPRVRYVGPMVLQNRGGVGLSDADRTRLELLFERRSGRSALIYAGFGSFFSTDLEFVRRLIDAVAGRRDWELVISLGGRLEPSALGPLPDRVHAFGWLPQLEILEHVDVAVVHGGINTVDECVLAGVPMLVYCGFETDMAGTASRVAHHGLGTVGDRRRDSPRVIRDRVERLLSEPAFDESLRRMRASYEAYAADRVLERAIESILADGAPGGPQ